MSHIDRGDSGAAYDGTCADVMDCFFSLYISLIIAEILCRVKLMISCWLTGFKDSVCQSFESEGIKIS